MKRSMRYGSNYWEVFSPKVKRHIRLFSDLEYDNWVLIETDPQIVTFCEQPLKINRILNNKRVESIFDMWIKDSDGKETFLEVKYENELKSENPRSKRTIQQTTIQQMWCEENGFDYKIRTDLEIRGNQTHLDNMKRIISYIKNHYSPNEMDEYIVLRIVKQYDGVSKLCDIENELSNYHPNRIKEAIYWLIYKGILRYEINRPLEPETEVWIHD